MTLANQDQLRLNVLLKQNPHAIRINESNLTVHALTPRGEALIQLHPTCSERKYLKLVRELLSNFALGSPEGYPVFLQRWRRLEGKQSENVSALLLLGEPEAIVDAARSSALTAKTATYVWWAMPTADIARTLLNHQCVVEDALAQPLIAFLIEFLPFETEPSDIVNSVRAILNSNLLDKEQRLALWQRAERNPAVYIGFLRAQPNDLPLEHQATAVHYQLQSAEPPLERTLLAELFIWFNSKNGQAFLSTLKRALEKLPNQETTVALFQSVQVFFADYSRDTDSINVLRNALPQHADKIAAMAVLIAINENQLDKIFAQTDAIGSVMRKKLLPITQPIFDAIATMMEGP